MLDRCYSKNCTAFPNYGRRGIAVSPRWRGVSGFNNFINDMGNRPDGTSLDRTNNELDYSKENCKWSTKSEQARNRRTNRVITVGKRSQLLIDWALESGIKRETIMMRLKLGWSAEDAVSVPPKKTRRVY